MMRYRIRPIFLGQLLVVLTRENLALAWSPRPGHAALVTKNGSSVTISPEGEISIAGRSSIRLSKIVERFLEETGAAVAVFDVKSAA